MSVQKADYQAARFEPTPGRQKPIEREVALKIVEVGSKLAVAIEAMREDLGTARKIFEDTVNNQEVDAPRVGLLIVQDELKAGRLGEAEKWTGRVAKPVRPGTGRRPWSRRRQWTPASDQPRNTASGRPAIGRRRTWVVRIFRNRAPAVRLIDAYSIQANEQGLERRYLPIEPERIEQRLGAWEAAAGESACSSPRSATLAAR